MQDERIAHAAANRIRVGFEAYHRAFSAINGRAKRNFELRQWEAARRDAVRRLELYKDGLRYVVEDVRGLLGDSIQNPVVWRFMKSVYTDMITELPQAELAETYFNSTTRRIFHTVGVNPSIEFVYTDLPAIPSPRVSAGSPIYRAYDWQGSTAATIRTILDACCLQAQWLDLDADLRLLDERLQAHTPHFDRIEMLRSLFFRGKGAYLIGRIIGPDKRVTPLCLSLNHDREGIFIDAALFDEDSISIGFSFAHAYFLVDIERPADYVTFLNELMPRKTRAELYISLGYNKHGKTELYRDFIQHLRHSNDQFEIARGTKGMVMTVFTLPSYELVFKIIKDRFDYPKRTTRADVMAKYDLVFKHDRAGRLVDAQAFEHLEFDQARFAPSLLEELQKVAAKSVTVRNNRVAIKHLYTERRITPLNIYLRDASPEQALRAALDYGQAIKDLAASNIFPGDLFLKNFGVTRHGRVIFYDYDELVTLDECNFRHIPPPRDEYDEYAAQPYFAVREGDVFPEQFASFLGFRMEIKRAFLREHRDILDPEFWRHMQKQHRHHHSPHIYPYRPDQHLRPERRLTNNPP